MKTINHINKKNKFIFNTLKIKNLIYIITLQNGELEVTINNKELKLFKNFILAIDSETNFFIKNSIGEYLIFVIGNKLINTQLSIFQIACEVGFYETTNLVKFFKKYKKLTPAEYRKKNILKKEKINLLYIINC